MTESFLNKLTAAGSAFGEVAGEFRDHFIEDRESQRQPDGSQEPVVERVREAVGEFRGVKDTDTLRTAATNFAGRAEDIVRDVAGSVTRAAKATRETDEFQDATNKAKNVWKRGDDIIDGDITPPQQEGQQ